MLLKTAGFDLKIMEPHIDESLRGGEDARAYVQRLAGEKSRVAIESLLVVVAADTSVVLDGKVLGKPHNDAEARDMLERLSGREHEVLTGFAVRFQEKLIVDVVSTRVSFRKLTDHDIESYVITKEPFDKAGGYGIQGYGAALVDRVEGSYTNVMGLPLKEVIEAIHWISK